MCGCGCDEQGLPMNQGALALVEYVYCSREAGALSSSFQRNVSLLYAVLLFERNSFT